MALFRRLSVKEARRSENILANKSAVPFIARVVHLILGRVSRFALVWCLVWAFPCSSLVGESPLLPTHPAYSTHCGTLTYFNSRSHGETFKHFFESDSKRTWAESTSHLVTTPRTFACIFQFFLPVFCFFSCVDARNHP